MLRSLRASVPSSRTARSQITPVAFMGEPMISLSDIQAAAGRIAPFIHRTPLIPSNSLSLLSGADVYLKLENLQKTGSFKVRGAFNKLLSVAETLVIAASMG